MEPPEFLCAVETLLTSHTIPQDCNLTIVVDKGELVACRPDNVKTKQDFIAYISRLERSNGLLSAKWDQIFRAMFSAKEKRILK